MGFSFALLLLAMAISLDSFSTGLAYGLRKMRIPIRSIFIIAMCTAGSLGIAMLAGQLIQQFLSPSFANRLGGLILIFIGAFVVFQFLKKEKDHPQASEEKLVLKWEIKSLGVVIHILKKPTMADMDDSGTVTGLEALLLGLALSLDAFGAGIGAAMLGFSPLLLATSAAVMSCLFLTCGLHIGRFFSKSSWMQKLAFLPGVLLMVIGMLKM
ncbi:sporulation membrane protein YtaF [Bacillus sp. FJAT-50079]|uniref:sporulation membrane protein YtaF n=1 Tax=Bacillus sp. FJAT-50079 TaxID=2833577 RepID=UPI001BC9FF11|nr:sporulation membrane protein YtaF [Bacillus sp. FJAT-50079]MBS4208798.1 sporulation membrane protein YtaF [Bacillus sp. FJAT-50079]